jgi:hypothetical protein
MQLQRYNMYFPNEKSPEKKGGHCSGNEPKLGATAGHCGVFEIEHQVKSEHRANFFFGGGWGEGEFFACAKARFMSKSGRFDFLFLFKNGLINRGKNKILAVGYLFGLPYDKHPTLFSSFEISAPARALDLRVG